MFELVNCGSLKAMKHNNYFPFALIHSLLFISFLLSINEILAQLALLVLIARLSSNHI